MASRLTDNPVPIHILIEGRPALTKRLWDRFPTLKPLILSSRIPISPVYFASNPRGVDPETGEPSIYPFWGTMLIPEMAKYDPENAALARRMLVQAVEIARERFALAAEEPVRIAVAGSQGSLWKREHSLVGVPGSPMVEDGDHRKGPLPAVSRTAQNRNYVACIYSALGDLECASVEWLAHVFPDLRPREPCQDRSLLDLAEDVRSSTENPSAPLLYTRRGRGGWKLYTAHLGKNHDAADRGRDPFRSTTKLIEQYRDDPSRKGLECVLVKVVSRCRPPNPCDNPIVTAGIRKLAWEAGITAILLDAGHGIVDEVDEAASGDIDAMIQWQRERMMRSLREASSLGSELSRLREQLAIGVRAGAESVASLISDLGQLRARLLEQAERISRGASITLSRYRPVRRLVNFLAGMVSLRTRGGRSPDDAPGDPSDDIARVEIGNVSNGRLIREMHVALSDVVETLDGALISPLNAESAIPILKSIGEDLVRVLCLLNEWQTRIESGLAHDSLLATDAMEWLRRRFRPRRVAAAALPSSRSFFKALEEHEALERLIAGKSRFAQLAAYPKRADRAPIYRV